MIRGRRTRAQNAHLNTQYGYSNKPSPSSSTSSSSSLDDQFSASPNRKELKIDKLSSVDAITITSNKEITAPQLQQQRYQYNRRHKPINMENNIEFSATAIATTTTTSDNNAGFNKNKCNGNRTTNNEKNKNQYQIITRFERGNTQRAEIIQKKNKRMWINNSNNDDDDIDDGIVVHNEDEGDGCDDDDDDNDDDDDDDDDDDEDDVEYNDDKGDADIKKKLDNDNVIIAVDDNDDDDDDDNDADDDNSSTASNNNFQRESIDNITIDTGKLLNTNKNKNKAGKTSNIFLQEPVLHLNIDKSLNQPSSITINKHLDVNPNFNKLIGASLVSFVNGLATTAGMPTTDEELINDNVAGYISNNNYNNNNNNNSKNNNSCGNREISKRHNISEKQTNNKIKNKHLYEIESSTQSDSSSCDSGVVIDDNNKNLLELNINENNKRRKPSTPHRILCPSPVKHVIVEKSTSTALSNLKISNKRNFRAKRRLNTHQMENLILSSSDTPTTTTIVEPINTINNNITNVEMYQLEFNEKSEPSPVEKRKSMKSTKDTKLTDFFPVRRSIRKTKKIVELEQLRSIEQAIQERKQDGLKIWKFEDKGRGVIAIRPFLKGEFVVEYIGDLIDMTEANRREQFYAKDENAGCYMYYFKYNDQQHCIDATRESQFFGRLVNHSRNGNLITRTVNYKNRPHLVLIAKETINVGEEITYDYGDRSKESLIHHPWLAL